MVSWSHLPSADPTFRVDGTGLAVYWCGDISYIHLPCELMFLFKRNGDPNGALHVSISSPSLTMVM